MLFLKNILSKINSNNKDIGDNKNNKKIIKVQGNENNYFEVDYREKYLALLHENFELKQKIDKINHDFNYSIYKIQNGDLKIDKNLEKMGIEFSTRPTNTAGDRVTAVFIEINNKDRMKFIEVMEKYYEYEKD
ncbi:hypothetical protein [Spiroplasma endosymbiont of Thecophora atra]|uniref:hypothetical protein n=1 Tax=Spiroplasma endosymbiont of Thecophora atra TaxID=3066294 RepID=UPI0030D0F511